MRIGFAVAALALAFRPAAPSAAQAVDVIHVCHWPDYYAISFINPKTNALEGLDVDLARAFAADLAARLTFVRTSFARFAEDLNAGRCDVAMFGVGVTPARAERVDYTQPYLRSDIYAIAPKAHPTIRRWADLDREDARIVVQNGTFMEAVARRTFRFATIVSVDAFQERERRVRSGRADAFLTDYPYGQRVLRLSDWARLLQPPEPLAPTDYAYAVAKGDAAWLARAEAFVRRIKADGRLKAAAAAHGLADIALVE